MYASDEQKASIISHAMLLASTKEIILATKHNGYSWCRFESGTIKYQNLGKCGNNE